VAYSAFISYSHRDERWAAWVHRAIERYRIPRRLIGHASRFGPLALRLPPVFRDREELATSSDLAAAVQAALAEAAVLIVICSPEAARSRWVNEEIRTFVRLGGRERILCLIVAGEPHAIDPLEECFPPALIEQVSAEPLAADVRPGQDGRQSAKLKLLAGLIGVGYDELRQRENAQRQRRLAIVAGVSAIGFLFTAALAIFAFIARNDAVQQRDVARQKTITAERTVDFVKSLFEVADPSEARGSTITAREILDRGAERIDASLGGEPAVKAELATTLGEVYLGLGLYRQADRLIRKTFGYRHDQPGTRARQYIALADSQSRQGEYAAAVRSYGSALALARDTSSDRDDLVPRALVGMGEAQSALEQYNAARTSIQEALRLDRDRLGSRDPGVARDLEALGLNAFYSGDLKQARQLLENALRIRIAAQGPLHPRVSEGLNMLGSIAYLQRDSAAAEELYRRVLATDRQVLGPNHPEVATTLNNLARVMLERRAFAEARPLLRRALAINLSQRDATHDDLAFTFANLAIAERGLGRAGEAEALLDKALVAARKHKSRNLGPILVDIADLRCRRGDVAGGLAMLAEADPIVRADYPDDPWRLAWLNNSRGGCLAAAGRTAEASRLLTRSEPILRERWAPGTLYAVLASDRRRTIGDMR
jgi:tetratricopeptide (TPR) repeat protein